MKTFDKVKVGDRLERRVTPFNRPEVWVPCTVTAVGDMAIHVRDDGVLARQDRYLSREHRAWRRVEPFRRTGWYWCRAAKDGVRRPYHYEKGLGWVGRHGVVGGAASYWSKDEAFHWVDDPDNRIVEPVNSAGLSGYVGIYLAADPSEIIRELTETIGGYVRRRKEETRRTNLEALADAIVAGTATNLDVARTLDYWIRDVVSKRVADVLGSRDAVAEMQDALLPDHAHLTWKDRQDKEGGPCFANVWRPGTTVRHQVYADTVPRAHAAAIVLAIVAEEDGS